VNVDKATQLWHDTTVLLFRESGRNQSSMNALFSSVRPIDINEDELVLSTPNLYTKHWIERQLIGDIQKAIMLVTGKRYGFKIVVDESVGLYPQLNDSNGIFPSFSTIEPNEDNEWLSSAAQQGPQNPAFVNTANKYSEESVSPYQDNPSNSLGYELNSFSPIPSNDTLLPTYAQYTEFPPKDVPLDTTILPIADQRMTFESFVIDDAANQLAFSTSVLVAKSPGYVINPLFIYGRSGLGKTHLLLSIRHYLEHHRPDLNVVYAQTNEMLAEYSFAATQGSFRDFDLKYKTADVFLLDDVQRLENRPGTVNIVFDIFNQMKDENKQIVLSSDRPPLEINLEERFLSRFSSGVIADVQPLSAETKLTIVSNYLPYCCRRLDCESVLALIGNDVIEHIVSLSGSNIRELEGALNNLVITLKHDKARFLPITPSEAEEIVSNHFRHLTVRDIDISAIQQAVEKYFNVRHEDILSSRRSHEISYPRQVAMYLCRNMTNASLPQISKAFNKDHTAVMYACNNIEKKRQLSSSVDSEVKHLVDVLTG